MSSVDNSDFIFDLSSFADEHENLRSRTIALTLNIAHYSSNLCSTIGHVRVTDVLDLHSPDHIECLLSHIVDWGLIKKLDIRIPEGRMTEEMEESYKQVLDKLNENVVIRLNGYSSNYIHYDKNFIIESNKAPVLGDFLKFLNSLETKFFIELDCYFPYQSVGDITSLKFKSGRDYSKLFDDCFQNIFMPQVKYLNIDENVSDIAKLVAVFPNLEEISISCNLTADDVENLDKLSVFQGLRSIKLPPPSGITNDNFNLGRLFDKLHFVNQVEIDFKNVLGSFVGSCQSTSDFNLILKGLNASFIAGVLEKMNNGSFGGLINLDRSLSVHRYKYPNLRFEGYDRVLRTKSSAKQ